MEIRKALLITVSVVTMMAGLLIAEEWQSELVYFDGSDKLVYAPEPYSGHRIGDFSHAGYMGGGGDLPNVPTVSTISAIAGDNTAHLQAAIDAVCALTPDGNGFRGALLLQAGTYAIDAPVYVTASGVVIRGEGDGSDPAFNTIIYRTHNYTTVDANNPDDPAYKEGVLTFQGVGGNSKFNRYIAGTISNITNDYIPVGSRTFRVDHPEYYNIGDRVLIDHPDTDAWLMSVDRGGVDWTEGMVNITSARRVGARNGNWIAVDAPIFFDIDKSLTQAIMGVFDDGGRISQVGVEDLRVDIETLGSKSEIHAHTAIRFHCVDDAWTLRCTGQHFTRAGFYMDSVHRATVRECEAIDPHSEVWGGRRYNFYNFRGQQILTEDCYANYARHAYICNGGGRDNCNVYLNNTGEDNYFSSEGHYRWVNRGYTVVNCRTSLVVSN